MIEPTDLVVGFTGTRKGMTDEQATNVSDLLGQMQSYLPKFHVAHGDCFGADHQFHLICRDLNLDVEIFPCTLVAQRAFLLGDVAHEPKPPLERNVDIVRASTYMIATPGTMEEELRSGTWATIRASRRHGRSLFITYPDGSTNYTTVL